MNKSINKKIDTKIMTHMIAFFPDKEESIRIAETLIHNGADILEIQFPFSDPTADGKYIEMACTRAIENGFNIKEGFEIINRIGASLQNEVKIFIMSYANTAFFYGIENWIEKAKESGADGLIIPDLPFDYDEGLYEQGKKEGIEIIPVITPNISKKRLKKIFDLKPGYIYTTLRKGITGSLTRINDEVLQYLEKLNTKGNSKILAGFGIHSRDQIEYLSQYVHAVVVGSAFIKAIIDNNHDRPHIAVEKKLKELVI